MKKIIVMIALYASIAIAQFGDIKIGERGIGKTVYEGIVVDSFGVEIIGIREIPMGDILYTPNNLGKLFGGPQKYPVSHTGVALGMSGSPIFINGKIIGALSTLGQFNKDPICGITPIDMILNMTNMRFFGGISLEFGTSHNFSLETSDTQQKQIKETGPLIPGSSIAVYLAKGDIDIAMYGVVTWRAGDTLYALGHGLWKTGKIELPFSGASVITTVANQVSSYKMFDNHSDYAIQGTVVYDSPVGIKGIVGKKIRMVPTKIIMRNAIDNYERTVKTAFAPMSDIILAYLPRIIINSAINGQPRKEKNGTIRIRHRIIFTDLPNVDVEYTYSFKQGVEETIITDYLWRDFYSLEQLLTYIAPEHIQDIEITIVYEYELSPLLLYEARIVGTDKGISGDYECWPNDNIYVQLKTSPMTDTSAHITAIVPVRIPKEAKEANISLQFLSGNYLRKSRQEYRIEKEKLETDKQEKQFYEWLIRATNESSNTAFYWKTNILLEDSRKLINEAKYIKTDTISAVQWEILPQEKIVRVTKEIIEKIPLPLKAKRQIVANRTLFIKIKSEKSLFERIFFPDKPAPKKEKK